MTEVETGGESNISPLLSPPVRISTKSVYILEAPVEWIFEFYLKLKKKLTGQRVMIKSPRKPDEKRASCSVYYSRENSRYLFNDFSSGIGGDHIDLMAYLMYKEGGASEDYLIRRVNADYRNFLSKGGKYTVSDMSVDESYKVTSFIKREWIKLDVDYWTSYGIGSSMLNFYRVAPLREFVMKQGSSGKEMRCNRPYIYGYFRKDGSLYKIYQPKSATKKFLKVRDYIQGTDQLTGKKPYLAICSSLKDIMSFSSMKFKSIEFVAPDSENVMISAPVIALYSKKYRKVFTIFDNDKQGVDAMISYEKAYGLPYVHLQMSKDIADSVKDHQILPVKRELYKLMLPILKP